ncbi:MAG TPA: copper resistance protein CopC [Chloroflexia bacterium]|nr:copper resistance protein CopC [Chloroflexia bacterium]
MQIVITKFHLQRALAMFLGVALLLASIGSAPGVALAHARVASSTPANGATVPPGLTDIIINFNEDISVDQSTAQLVNEANNAVLQATAAVDRANRKKMTIKTSPLAAGKYQVKWTAVTEDDNGITSGTISFTVGGAVSSECQTFQETGKTACGRFLQYWKEHGGLAQQGYPISNEFQEKSDTDGKTYTVQYFERAVFEAHPENPAPNDVLLSLLGNFLYKQKYPNGAPAQRPNTTAGSVLFRETGKRLGGKFLDYWNKNGGLAQQGFPVSDEFQEKSDLDGKTYTVQYFERAVFEMHPENPPPFDVLLSQLGTFQLKKKYPNGAPQTSAEVNVDIVDFKFAPETITVNVGTKVTWTQIGPTEHNTVHKGSRPLLWDSPIMKTRGEKYSYTFTKAGTYDYWCTIHPEMLGKVIVR